MNSYVKYVLIPQQEYSRLKKPTKTSIILNSNKPSVLKRSDITRQMEFKEPPIFGQASTIEDDEPRIEDIEESNMPESVKSKLIDDLEYSTPASSFGFEKQATNSGRLYDRRGKIVPKSNIKAIKEYLLSSKGKKQPAGTQAALDHIAHDPKALRKLRNPNIRRRLNLDQIGSGWSTLRKF